MSYILDALKKSDQERKQGDVPNLQTVHVAVAPELKKPWAMYAVIVFLLMVLVLLMGVLVLEKEDADLSLNDQQMSLPQLDVKNEAAVNAKAHNENAGVAFVEPEKSVLTRSKKPEKKLELLQQEKTSVAVKPNKVVEKQQLPDINDIPYLQELDGYQQQLVPDMSFAGHVYSSDAASRSVIINGQAMSEGESLMQGMSIEQITSRGVIFRFNDILFRVDVLQDWSFE